MPAAMPCIRSGSRVRLLSHSGARAENGAAAPAHACRKHQVKVWLEPEGMNEKHATMLKAGLHCTTVSSTL
eukprot:scaffold200717_cov17-Tisochrysis_lutea.AAC.1